MQQKPTTKQQPRAVRGQEVIEEAARLIRQMRFSANRGAYAEGKHVAVSLDPRWNDDKETISVLITCYAFGHRQVDWVGQPVFILGEKVSAVSKFNLRGQAIQAGLPPGDYRLTTSPVYGRSVAPVPLPTRVQALAATGTARARGVAEKEGLLEPVVYESVDGRVRATVRQTKTGKTEVAFETNDETLAGATVRFAFVEESGRVELSDEVKLEPVEGEERLWEGYREELVEPSEPCELVFEVLRKGG